MTFAILCAVFGILIGAATIFVPRLLASLYNRPYDHADSRAYLKRTGRSVDDIAQSGHGQRPYRS